MKFNATIELHDSPIALTDQQLETCKAWAKQYLHAELVLISDAIRTVLSEKISTHARTALTDALALLPKSET